MIYRVIYIVKAIRTVIRDALALRAAMQRTHRGIGE
jgi:hypothetical protein